MFDPILSPRAERFVLFPIEFPELFRYYQEAVANFWQVQEVDLSKDKRDFESLTSKEQHFVKHVLAFFAASDGIVNENLCHRFATEVQPSEARAFYALQIAIEAIHSHQYSLMIDTLVGDPREQAHLFSAIDTIPCIQNKAAWALKWLDSDAPFAQRLIAFACIEGIHFSGSFCSIFWLKKQGKMPGLAHANELISRDEGQHRDFACLLHGMLTEPCSQEKIYEIIREAVDIEKDFVTDALPVSLIGMNAGQMQQYIEFVADHLLQTLGVPPIYKVTNPFPFMDLISLQGKTNFFERRVSEYQKANATTSLANNFSLDEEF
jgi:ribonucleotide reductase beta subunit family protein with ferritin-like domain